MRQEYKPNKNAYIFSRLIFQVLVLLLLFVGVYIFLKVITPEYFSLLYIIGAIVFLVVFLYYYHLVAHRKLIFYFEGTKIIQKGGTIFSDYETELNIKNITHLRLRLPFIEYKLFRTGHVDIESAGSASSEIHLCSMLEYKDIHSLVLEMMKTNGFNIGGGTLATLERPNKLGVFFETFKSLIGSLLAVFYIVSSIMYDDDGNRIEVIYDLVIAYVIPFAILLVLVFSFFHIFKFLDLQRRVYKIYTNVITYKEGFLSKNYSILPFENLTDSSVTQTLVDKIFGLYDVKLSCQGAGQEILFKNIKNGQAMSDKLDELISAEVSEEIEREEVVQTKKAQQERAINYDTEFKSEYKMDYFRTVKFPMLLVLGAVLFFILSLLIIKFVASTFVLVLFSSLNVVTGIIGLVSIPITVYGYIQYISTKYIVTDKSIQYKYDFLEKRDKEYNADKVTGIIIKRNFIDEWFGTISINFWSIGSSTSLSFRNVKREDVDIQNILAKFGIRREEALHAIHPSFSFREYIKKSIVTFSFFAFLVISFGLIFFFIAPLITFGLILAITFVVFVSFVYNKEYFKRTKLIFYKNYVYCQKGWLFKNYVYVKMNDIKDIETVRYPFSSEGKIKFNISGDRIQIDPNHKKGNMVSNNFYIDFVENIKSMDEWVDYILYKRPRKEELNDYNSEIKNLSEVFYTSKPSLLNTMIPLLFVLIPVNLLFLFIFIINSSSFIFVVAVFVIFNLVNAMVILPVYLPIKMTTFYMDRYRVISKSGVIYKKQVSIIFDRVDFIRNTQGLINKLFKNGNIIVNTVGSTKPELTIYHIPDYKEFYSKLKEEYEKP
ncbi:hypothetical protein C0584_03705 [Candidatus Parcubacteria bacterium]|nr:MAG: hypothetical protein C0584_03705 [Candidatus Parcubacteria bacterium]